MTVAAIVYGLQQKYLAGETALKPAGASLEPWMYIDPKKFGQFADSGGPMGCVCGAALGPDFLITLITGESATGAIRTELYEWYGNTALPSADWDFLFEGFENTVQSKSESAVCHISRSKWEWAYLSVKDPDEAYDLTRCDKVHGDCTKKAVEMLNEWAKTGTKPAAWAADANFKACYDCHKTTLGGSTPPSTASLGFVKNGREDCTICHDVPASHGKTKGPK